MIYVGGVRIPEAGEEEFGRPLAGATEEAIAGFGRFRGGEFGGEVDLLSPVGFVLGSIFIKEMLSTKR